MSAGVGRDAAAVYVHFPWCLHRCSYCDFATTAHHAPPVERYTTAVLRELELRAADWRPDEVSSVFFGGGTPSLWGARHVAAVIDAIAKWTPLRSDAEISLEVNPSSGVGLTHYADAGVNRVSIGVQAFDDRRLRALDRIHDVTTARRTLQEVARLLHEGTLMSASADLMFGGPGQSLLDLEHDVTALKTFDLPHLSAYALTVEEGTPLARQVERGLVSAPDPDLQAEMLVSVPELLASHGLERYEVSNFAKPGHECRHNLAYWRGDHYLALGVGGHGFVPSADPEDAGVGRRYANIRSSALWMDRLEKGALAEDMSEHPTGHEHLQELLLTGLRLREGLDLTTVQARLGSTVRLRLERAAEANARHQGTFVLAGDRLSIATPHWTHLDRHILGLVRRIEDDEAGAS